MPTRRALLSQLAFAAAPLVQDPGRHTLICIFLRGGADTMNLIVPYADDGYYKARPSLAIARPGGGTNAALRLDDHYALHPSLAPLGKGPYYAVKIQVGSFGTFAGIAVDALSRVKTAEGGIVEGLYAVGCDQKSVFGGHYPCGGINIGPALTFGYAVGRHLAGISRYEDDGSQFPSADYQGTAGIETHSPQ